MFSVLCHCINLFDNQVVVHQDLGGLLYSIHGNSGSPTCPAALLKCAGSHWPSVTLPLGYLAEIGLPPMTELWDQYLSALQSCTGSH